MYICTYVNAAIISHLHTYCIHIAYIYIYIHYYTRDIQYTHTSILCDAIINQSLLFLSEVFKKENQMTWTLMTLRGSIINPCLLEKMWTLQDLAAKATRFHHSLYLWWDTGSINIHHFLKSIKSPYFTNHFRFRRQGCLHDSEAFNWDDHDELRNLSSMIL